MPYTSVLCQTFYKNDRNAINFNLELNHVTCRRVVPTSAHNLTSLVRSCHVRTCRCAVPPYLSQPRIHHEVPVMCGRVGVPCPPPTHPRSSARVVPECAHLHCWVDLNAGIRLETESPAPLMLAP
jgi:hypothetical protein